MADDEVGLDPPRAQRRKHGETGRNERRLLHLGLDELLFAGSEAQPLKVELGGDAAPLEDVHRLRHGLGDLPAHAHLERALARKAEGDESRLHAVHSIKAEPHVSPAPMPVINTRSPSSRRP